MEKPLRIRRTKHAAVLLLIAGAFHARGQEARFGFTDPLTITLAGSHSRQNPSRTFTPAIRANFYPSLKLGSNWFAYGAIQVHSSGFFYEELQEQKRHLDIMAIQAYIGYSRVSNGKAITVKAGQLASAFGSFALRYDDSRNWLIDLPQSYGYYYFPVTVAGMPGAEVDVALGKADLRAQLTNSSPSNPRSFRQSDQYANWTFGGGYTIRQGFRIGASGTHGAYLHRQHRFFFPGEAAPKALPATGYGTDVQWGRGRWTANAEAMRFQYPYRAIPYFFNTAFYAEAKFTISARWFLAARSGSRWRTAGLGHDQAYEGAVGYRPAAGHLVKAGYLALRSPFERSTRNNVIGFQYVMTFTPPAWTWGQ